MHGGATIGGWIDIEDDCAMSYTAFTKHVEISFGHGSGQLVMVIELGALAALGEAAQTALTEARARAATTSKTTSES
ncbi:MAG TPA: hypothetical protein VG317_12715 [Pseudonocardiaceae bacterium]|nr:hypothetical protein [Pseudonocardiaceae bacterium]